MTEKKCPFEEMLRMFQEPDAFLKPGQKISRSDDTLIQKGGMRAFFNDGLNFKDFNEGVISKRLIIVQDDYGLRQRVRDMFKPTAMTPFAAGCYQDALGLIYPRFEDASPFRYAIIDNKFPEQRGQEPKYLGNKLIDELLKKHEGIRIFGYVDDFNEIDQTKCVGLIHKNGDESLKLLYSEVIKDAETIRE